MNVCQVKGPRNAKGQTDWNFYNVYWCRGITTHVHRITADVCRVLLLEEYRTYFLLYVYVQRFFTLSLSHRTHTHTHTPANSQIKYIRQVVCARVCTCWRDKREWEIERERERESWNQKFLSVSPLPVCACCLETNIAPLFESLSLFLFYFSLSLTLCPHREWCGHKFVPHISFPKFWRKETKLKQTDKIETNLFSIQLFNDRDRKKRKY